MHYVYIFYRIEKYPEINEPAERADGVFRTKKDLTDAIKKMAKKYPILYTPDSYRIAKVKLNEFYEI